MEGKNESKHTPGPWVLRRGFNFFNVESNGEILAKVYLRSEEGAGNYANAELIASAPALLEENEKLKRDVDQRLTAIILKPLESMVWPISHNRGDFLAVGISLNDVKALYYDSNGTSSLIDASEETIINKTRYIKELQAEVDRLKNDLKHSEERADQRLDSYTKMANYATDFKVEVDRITKEKSECIKALEPFEKLAHAFLDDNNFTRNRMIYAFDGVGFDYDDLRAVLSLLTRIK